MQRFPILDVLARSGDIRDQSLMSSKIDRNFVCFWPTNFFVSAPLILYLQYKIHADSDQMAKFQGDRSRELGERWAKKKEQKHHQHFISPPVTTYGRPNY